MKGRKPVPTILLRTRGTFEKSRHSKREAEPQPDGSPHEPPAWMSDDQKASWNFVIEHAPRGVLKKIDQGILTAWIIAESQHRTAAIMLAKLNEGAKLPMLSKGRDGVVGPNPYIRF